jgi:pyrimidine-nucleoside phosphorylase
MHGADERIIDNPSLLGTSRFKTDLKAERDGFLARIDPEKIGLCLTSLGAGREKVADLVDHTVGLALTKKTGDRVQKGEPIGCVHYNDEQKFNLISEELKQAFFFSTKKPRKGKLVRAIIS